VRYFVLTVAVFLLFAMQTPVLSVLGLSVYSVDIALIAVIYMAAAFPALGGFLTAVAVGFIADSFTPGGVLGMNMEIMGILFLMARGLAERFKLLRTLSLILAILAGSVVKVLLVFLFSMVFDRNMTQYSTVFAGVVSHSLTTAVAGIVLVPLLRLVDGRARGRMDSRPRLRL